MTKTFSPSRPDEIAHDILALQEPVTLSATDSDRTMSVPAWCYDEEELRDKIVAPFCRNCSPDSVINVAVSGGPKKMQWPPK